MYRPPASICEEFEVEMTNVTSPSTVYSLKPLGCACILLVYKGVGDLVCGNQEKQNIHAGHVLFIPANTSVEVTNVGAADSPELTLFRAHINCENL